MIHNTVILVIQVIMIQDNEIQDLVIHNTVILVIQDNGLLKPCEPRLRPKDSKYCNSCDSIHYASKHWNSRPCD